MISSPAYRTHLATRLKSAYLDYVLAVGFGFVLTHTAELRPTLFADTTSQRGVSDHTFDVQVFKTQSVIAIEQISGEFVQIVRTLIAYLLMQFSHDQALFVTIGTAAAAAALLLAGKATLFYTKSFQVAGKKLLVLKFLPVTSDQKRLNTQIKPNGSSWIYGFRLGRTDGHINQDRDKVLAGCRATYRRGFNRALKLTMQYSNHPLTFGQKHFTRFKINFYALWQLKRLFTVLGLKAGKSRTVTEKVSECVSRLRSDICKACDGTSESHVSSFFASVVCLIRSKQVKFTPRIR